MGSDKETDIIVLPIKKFECDHKMNATKNNFKFRKLQAVFKKSIIANDGSKVAAVYEYEDERKIFIFSVETGEKLHFLDFEGLAVSPDLCYSVKLTTGWVVRALNGIEERGRIICNKNEHKI